MRFPFLMRVLLFSVFVVCLTAVCLATEAQRFTDTATTRSAIQQWILQLGDESFLVRQRAESLLIHSGIRAHPELQRARQSRDLEIARRAEYVLSQIEQTFLDTENRAVALWVRWYIEAPHQASKAQIIWALADPTLDHTRGEGLHTLCRFVRFEESDALRLEAAKTLIAYPPVSPLLRQQWYQYIWDNFREAGENDLFQTLAHYAKLWCDLDEADDKTTPELQNRVRQVSADTLRLLERPENAVQVGSGVDIMLHYAVAELQDATGLIEDRDAVVAAALAVQPGPIQTTEALLPVGDHRDLSMYEHYHAGSCLRLRFRLRWATAHFHKVIETGDVVLRVAASRQVAEIALYFADYAVAAAFYDKHMEILDSPDYRREHNPDRQLAQAQKSKLYALAENAKADENWESVREYLTQAWSVPNAPLEISDIDLVILTYQLCRRHPEVVFEFRNRLEPALRQLWKSIVDTHESGPIESRMEKMPITCNIAAWLLANTEGDYDSALTLVEAALKIEPDDASILDTLAHVYFLGGKIDEAIRVQEEVVRLAPEATIFRQVLERFQQAGETETNSVP